jgi:hypothetical protein
VRLGYYPLDYEKECNERDHRFSGQTVTSEVCGSVCGVLSPVILRGDM